MVEINLEESNALEDNRISNSFMQDSLKPVKHSDQKNDSEDKWGSIVQGKY